MSQLPGIKEEPTISPEITEEPSDCTNNRYKVTICQDGRFAITFDTVNLRIRILENTDYRSFKSKNDRDFSRVYSESEEINKTIAHFKINDDLTIKEFYDPEIGIKSDGALNNDHSTTKNEDKYRWSFDISNLRKRGDRHGMIAHLLDGDHGGNSDNKCFILVAVSRMNVDSDMRKGKNKNNETNSDYVRGYLKKMKYQIYDNTTVHINELSENELYIDIDETSEDKGTAISESEMRKGTAIYCLKLEMKSKESNEEMGSYVLSGNVDCFYSDSVSGICKFVNATGKSEINVEQERFIILNFHGIYNFEFNDAQKVIRINLNEKFEYPKSIRRELDNWYIEDDCMRRLRSCIYDKYFLVTQYKNDVQSFEVYNLAKMELETTAKKVENKDKFVRQYNYDTFSISRLQLCFTRGINRVRLYYIENGLQIASKDFDEIERIHLLEFIDSDKKILIIGRDRNEKLNFIVWDLYKTNKVISTILNDYSINDLDQTSGNIIHVDNKGNVTSVLKRIENELKEQVKEPKLDSDAEPIENSEIYKYKHKIHYNKDSTPNFNKDKKAISTFRKIANEMEPWVFDNHETKSYCLYYNEEGTKTEFLQLIVGRSTIQIWHHFRDQPGEKDQLPNKGDSFLEYIWTNGIPVDQERKETRLRIKNFKYRSNDVDDDKGDYKLNDFSLEVYWYIRKKGGEVGSEVDSEVNKIIVKENEETHEMETVKENEEIHEFEMGNVTNETSMYVKKKTMVIRREDVVETFHPIRYACKALKRLNKRYIYKCLADNYNKVHKYEEIITYINHIVWRFAKHYPEQFNLLDIRYNFMKSLILGDCDHLIKFILFGDEGSNENDSKVKEKEKREKRKEFEVIRHIPRNKLWPGKNFIRDDVLDFHRKENSLKDNENIKPENDMELAIYHCEGREPNDAIIVAYLLEYYSRHATDYAGWMCTISGAIPLLFKYNYDDFIRKLFRKEFFADYQHHLLERGFDNEITTEYPGRLNNVIKFRATNQPINKLMSDKDGQDGWSWCNIHIKSITHIIYEFFDKNHKKPPLALRIKRNDRHRLSPFSRMVLYENNDDIYDNPALEAVMDFRWQKAKKFFISTFIRIFIFAICFVIVSWEYLVHEVISENYRNFLVALIFMFYYLAIYLLVTEVIQLKYHGLGKYLNLFNFFDICSIVLPVIVMSIMIKEFQFYNGFGNIETVDTGLMVGISFSIFLFWIELIFHLRLISRTGIYLYYSLIIFDTILPFFFFMLITVLAFAHSMFILLRDPVNINTKDQTLSGSAINTLTNEALDIKLKSDFDPESRIDNPFSSLSAAIVAAYFWINGNWVQRDEFDFWAVDIFTVIASVVLVIFIQNLLIAYMGGMHERANTEGRQTLLRYRARYAADYEALNQIHFWKHEDEPKYIYYFGHLRSFEEWYEIKKGNQDAIYKEFEEKSIFIRRIFKEEDYDKFSILKYHYYDAKIEEKYKNIKIEKIKNMKNDIVDNIEDLIKEFGVTKNDNEIELINDIKNSANNKIDRLIEAFE